MHLPWRRKKQANNCEWSISPGCFEEHLLRRFNNPLFPTSRRRVTGAELRAAKDMDDRDAANFKVAYAAHVKEGSRLDGKETLGYVGDYLRRTLELMERISAMGGSWEAEMDVLGNTVEACKDVLNSHTDKEAARVLDRLIGVHHVLISNPFLAKSSRPDSPIPQKDEDQWIRALLSEDDVTIERIANWAGGMGLKLIDRARVIMAKAVRDGLPVIEARRKLGVLEAGHSEGAEIFRQSQAKHS